MKTQIIFTCARCGKEQVDDLNWFNVRKFTYKELARGITPNVIRKRYELCDDCYRSLTIWLQNGNEYEELINENNTLKKQKNYLDEQRVNLQTQLRETESSFENCKMFCPRGSSDWKEYQEWYKEKHKDDIQ